MDHKHDRPSRQSRDEESDVRGEHVYSDETVEPNRPASTAERPLRDPHRYVAGAEGTQEIRTPDGDR